MSANATLTTGSSLCAQTKAALGLLIDTATQLRDEALSLDELSRCNAHQHPFENSSRAYSRQIEEFQRDMQERWGFKCTDAEIGGLHVPHPRGYCKTLLILPPAGIIAGPEDICAKWRAEKKFNVLTFADGELNAKIPNDRRHLGMYALLHKGERDADDELRSYSFEKARGEGVETMRATELLYFEDCNFRKKKVHLDPQTATITGSLDGDGYAVGVYWYDLVHVNQFGVQNADPNYGPRAAVYL